MCTFRCCFQFMRISYLILFLLIEVSLEAQTEGKNFYFKEIGWSLVLPATFHVNDTETDKKLQDKGIETLENGNDLKVGDISALKDLISASKGEFEYINATIRPISKAEEKQYQRSIDSVKLMLYKALEAKAPSAKIDTLTKIDTLNGLIFDKFEMTITMNGTKLLTMIVMSKAYKGYDFGITYVYLNRKTKEEIENMLVQSKFEK